MVFIGVDPGQSGGIAILNADGSILDVFPMPATDQDLLDKLTPRVLMEGTGGRVHAVLERAGVMPKQGIVSAFTYGQNVGALKMALASAWIPFDQAAPAVWQRAMQCLSRGDKNITKRRAQQLFPQTKVTHAIADALLIAEYCRRLRGTYGKEEKREGQPPEARQEKRARARLGLESGGEKAESGRQRSIRRRIAKIRAQLWTAAATAGGPPRP